MKKVFFFMIISMEIFAITPDKIIKNVEHNLQSNNSYSQITMTVTTVRGERMMKMESWNRGHEKSFIKVLYPKQDRGITFLKIDTTMWQYVPKIEKTIKIPFYGSGVEFPLFMIQYYQIFTILKDAIYAKKTKDRFSWFLSYNQQRGKPKTILYNLMIM